MEMETALEVEVEVALELELELEVGAQAETAKAMQLEAGHKGSRAPPRTSRTRFGPLGHTGGHSGARGAARRARTRRLVPSRRQLEFDPTIKCLCGPSFWCPAARLWCLANALCASERPRLSLAARLSPVGPCKVPVGGALVDARHQALMKRRSRD